MENGEHVVRVRSHGIQGLLLIAALAAFAGGISVPAATFALASTGGEQVSTEIDWQLSLVLAATFAIIAVIVTVWHRQRR